MANISVDTMTVEYPAGESTYRPSYVEFEGVHVLCSMASDTLTGTVGSGCGVFQTYSCPTSTFTFTAKDGAGNDVSRAFTFTPLVGCDAETALLRIKGRVAEVKAWADSLKVPKVAPCACEPEPETLLVNLLGYTLELEREPGGKALIKRDGFGDDGYCSERLYIFELSRLLTGTDSESSWGIGESEPCTRYFYRKGASVCVTFARGIDFKNDTLQTIACVLKKRAEKVIAAFKELENNTVVQVLGKSVTLHLKKNGTVGGVTVDGVRYDSLGRRASTALTGIVFLGGGPSIFCPACVGVATPRDDNHTVDWDSETFYGENGTNMTPAEFVDLVEKRTAAVKRAIAERTPDPCDCAAKTLVVRRDTPGEEVSFIYDGAAYGRTRNADLWELSRKLTGTCDGTWQGIFENDTGLESESFTAMYSDGSTSCERVFTFGDNLNLHTDSIEEIGRKIAIRVGVVKAWADRVRGTLPDQKTGTYTVTL